ncbi:glycosyltransferase family 77 [Micractinium conductrix]|uniref:Glycosyltransferase family 77 n=1 Tax=Micractinium conductrix TaxID=554055 RepID=A0A2P6V3D1_9CHLO|nr:glycosyltransferase family 77 [Micractinium conductrix]|eukprot:PSC68599.1 glycosyltransferase family 77 [Micractinium conductrix]
MVRIRSAHTTLRGSGGVPGASVPLGALYLSAAICCTLLLSWRLLSIEHGMPASHRSLPGDDSSISASEGRSTGFLQQSQQQQQAGVAVAAPPPPPPSVPYPDLDAVPYVVVCFSDSGYADLLLNWIASIKPTGAPFLIAAMDDRVMQLAAEERVPALRADLPEAGSLHRDIPSFRAIGTAKTRFVLGLLEAHPSLPVVVVADSDQVWLRPPGEFLAHHPAADFYTSTDCLSHQLEEEIRPHHKLPRCGHIPNNTEGLRAFNGGLWAARNTPAARDFLHAWAAMLTDDQYARTDDQHALNILLEKGELRPAGPDEPRAVMAWEGKLKVQPFPVILFANGHVAFVQRLPWRHGVVPIAIHTTFQRSGVLGKVARLREFGLWLRDTPQYYGAAPLYGSPPVKFLAYENDVLAFVAEQEAARYGSRGHGMPLMEAHMIGMAYQLAMMRDAMAVARMLGRAVVLPTLWCWCDFDESPDIMETCRIKGTDLPLHGPFECPVDYPINVYYLQSSGVDWRPAGFLHLPQLPPQVRHGRAVVAVAAQRPAQPFPPPPHVLGHGVVAWQGITQGELLQVVAPVAEAPVLVLRGQLRGFLGGFDGPSVSAAFDQTFEAILGNEGYWCCATWGPADLEYRKFFYARPPRLADGWHEWRPPTLELYDWCDKVSATDGNRKFTQLPQHPCAFLRNTTAAEVASGGAAALAARGPPLSVPVL